MSEKQPFLSDQIITYMGNKRKLLGKIGDAVDRIGINFESSSLRIGDGFSGSGIVSRLLKTKAGSLFTNDLAGYSYIMNECYLSTPSTTVKNKIYKYIDQADSYGHPSLLHHRSLLGSGSKDESSLRCLTGM